MTKSTKSSKTGELIGSQEPSERVVPSYNESDGMDALKILQIGGINLDQWQADILCDWLGHDVSGRWSAPTAGGSVPRQNGKTLLIQARAAVGMIFYNEQVVYTAHLQKTATETFEELRAYFESPKLTKYVKNIATAIGRESITLKNGARIKFLARTRNGGRGQHGDCLIFDEAQELDDKQQGSFLPAISASLNPQTIYVGTPPDKDAFGAVFGNIRKSALEGKSKKTAWFEFGVKEVGDVRDHKRWAECNPAFGRRMLESTIEAECDQMDPETFARERLGWWQDFSQVKEKVDYVIDAEQWDKCASSELKPEGKTAYGIKFTPDGSEVVLCGAVIGADNKARISLIDRKSTGHGIQWLADWLNQRYTQACCVVIDGRVGVDVLCDKISTVWISKQSIIRPSAKDMLAAVGQLLNEVSECSLTWYEKQEALRDSATTSTRRMIGQGFGFGGENSAPVEACALALWGVRTTHRDPSRRMRIG